MLPTGGMFDRNKKDASLRCDGPAADTDKTNTKLINNLKKKCVAPKVNEQL